MGTKRPSFSDQLRLLIETSGQTRYQIGKATGIDTATLSRFMHGKGGLSMPNLDTLAVYLGWTITAASKPTKRKGSK